MDYDALAIQLEVLIDALLKQKPQSQARLNEWLWGNKVGILRGLQVAAKHEAEDRASARRDALQVALNNL